MFKNNPNPAVTPPHLTKNNPHWIWKVYLIFVFFAAYKKFAFFLHPFSKINDYFVILYAFDFHFYLDYFCNMIQVFLNLFQCVPLFFFIYKRPAKNIHLWRVLFIFKIIFDVIGNSYILNEYKAAYHDGGWLICISYLIFSIALYIPSTLIWFFYAFKEEYLYAFNKPEKK